MHLDGVTWFEPGRSSALKGPMLRVGPQYVNLSEGLALAMRGQSWHVGVRPQDGMLVLFAQPIAKGVNVTISRSTRRLGGRSLATFLRENGAPQEWTQAHVQRVGQGIGSVRVEWPL